MNTTENLEVKTYADGKIPVKTYANGYGAWVALVPRNLQDAKARAEIAYNAINAELALREGPGFAGVNVERVSTMEMASADRVDYVMYREV